MSGGVGGGGGADWQQVCADKCTWCTWHERVSGPGARATGIPSRVLNWNVGLRGKAGEPDVKQ